MPLEIEGLDAIDLAALVRSGEVSALELVDDAIDRCERVNTRGQVPPLVE